MILGTFGPQPPRARALPLGTPSKISPLGTPSKGVAQRGGDGVPTLLHPPLPNPPQRGGDMNMILGTFGPQPPRPRSLPLGTP